jgi:uncharacterized membrane protein
MGYFFAAIIIAAIAIAVINIMNNNKHKKETKLVIDSLVDFNADKEYLSTSSGVSLGFDQKRRKICFIDKQHKVSTFDYKQILQCEVILDGESILRSSTSGTIGRTVLGGILGGGIGAIIGGTTGSRTQKEKIKSIDLKFIINDTNNPVYKVNFLNIETKKGSIIYNASFTEVEKWHGIISGLIRQGNEESNTLQIDKSSVADELKKLKELLDNGVLTVEEFNKEKSKIIA